MAVTKNETKIPKLFHDQQGRGNAEDHAAHLVATPTLLQANKTPTIQYFSTMLYNKIRDQNVIKSSGVKLRRATSC